MTKFYVNDLGTWRKVQRLWIKSQGNWIPSSTAFVSQSGVAKQFYPEILGPASYTLAGTYSYTVPAGATSLIISTQGGGGGAGGTHSSVGGQGYPGNTVSGTLAVNPGDIISVDVGGGGEAGVDSGVGGRAFAVGGTSNTGYGGGISGSKTGWSSYGGGGGAATVLKLNETIILVAGGGGGGGGDSATPRLGTNVSSGSLGGAGVQGAGGDSSSAGGGGGGVLGGNGGNVSGNWAGSNGSNLVPLGFAATILARGTSNAGIPSGTQSSTATSAMQGKQGFVIITVDTNSIAYNNPGDFSFTVPDGVTTMTAEIIGGGGAGGYGIQSGLDLRPGSGGGSGGVQTVTISVTPGQILTGTVGARGVAGTTSGYAQSGGNSSVTYASNTFTATGGGGGHGPVGNNAAAAAGAAGTPNGVAGGYIYSNPVNRNRNVIELGGVNSKGVGSGGNGRSGNGVTASTSGAAGRVTLKW
jgi:hypothetical protein